MPKIPPQDTAQRHIWRGDIIQDDEDAIKLSKKVVQFVMDNEALIAKIEERYDKEWHSPYFTRKKVYIKEKQDE